MAHAQKDNLRAADHYKKLTKLYKDPEYQAAAKKRVECNQCDSGATQPAGLLGEGEGVIEVLLEIFSRGRATGVPVHRLFRPIK